MNHYSEKENQKSLTVSKIQKTYLVNILILFMKTE